ncbi:hypothetical protein BDR07DRAFT_1389182 [Suillus spraguei]|nr:hypothetical protein BDR07DRAFT_1389182 [Suillus spraguei]
MSLVYYITAAKSTCNPCIYSVSQSAHKGAYWWKNDSGYLDDFPWYTTSEIQDTLDCCGFLGRTWLRILKLSWEAGDVVNSQPHRALRGCVRVLDRGDIDCLLRLVREKS